jgi:hypothetical protein
MSIAPITPSTRTAAADLETRIEKRKRELISEVIEHKKNCSRAGAADAADRAKARLSELARIVKESVVDGWANVDRTTKLRLDEWIAR